jgi:predicted secreted hydrolase
LVSPRTFQPAPADDAYHPDLNPGFFEWWYFDALFENSWSCVVSFRMPGLHADGNIEFALYDPQGKKTNLHAPIPAAEVSASTSTCDVRMGGNWARGEFPQWQVHFQHEDLGCDLTFRSLTQGVIPPAGGGNFSSEELPHRYMHWVVAQPRAEVKGEIRIAGKTFAADGEGYHDHNWGTGGSEVRLGIPLLDALAGLYDHWYWGTLYLPRHTLIYTVGRGSEGLGHRTLNAFASFGGETLLARSNNVTLEELDCDTDPETGCRYPRELVIRPEDPLTKGIITLRLRKFMDSVSFFLPGHGYLRFLYDCHATIDFGGEKIEFDDTSIHEYMRP